VSLRKLGRYDIVRVLGKGAMGIVYEGRDPNLDRRVAIKTVKVENLAPEAAAEYEARFRTEARSAARLQHPNIVSVYDSDQHGDVAYLVMEYVEGDDLKHHLDGGKRYSLEQTLHLVDDLLSALDYAHRHGVVHRDVKPANLLLEASGRLKLTDFGVARMQDGDATRTQGAMVGTLKYMAPEQVQGLKVDTRADLFSVGVVLYQLLTDQRPFDGENEFAIIHQIVGHTPPPPSAANARLPAAVDAVVARALAKKPDERFATAGEFAAALRAAMRQVEDPTIVPPANPARAHPGAMRSVTSPGTSPLGNSTVTQELELVYWKDVKDSADPEDLEVFLAKFPAGIYADLARRRLRKLAAAPVADQTVLSGMLSATQGAAADTAAVAPPGDLTEPQVRFVSPEDSTFTLPSPRAPAGEASATELPAGTLAEPAPREDTTVPLAPATAAVAAVPERVAPAARPRVTRVWLAGIGALAVAALAALLMSGRSGEPSAPAVPASGAASAPLSTPVSASARTAAPAVAPAQETHGVAGAPADPAAISTSGAASHGRAASHPKRPLAKATAPAPTTVEARSTATPAAPAEARDQPRVAAAPAPARASASNPADLCKDKVFLSLEFCLAEQCDKPGARNHPLCVKRREEARLREDSKVRN
jgi:serine/threonine protein kinase